MHNIPPQKIIIFEVIKRKPQYAACGFDALDQLVFKVGMRLTYPGLKLLMSIFEHYKFDIKSYPNFGLKAADLVAMRKRYPRQPYYFTSSVYITFSSQEAFLIKMYPTIQAYIESVS